ncbi:NitT/TauT family transport system ATP-binding protein [Rhodobacter sp. 140A]|jgi:ABC-type nitrate/sulfonate/bicarbonate transport system, ATPase component|uniref:ABC transporter ATP-binding protein n=1 Tax=Thioclava TaxID=285107 RepID=UPI000C3DE713|nr:MULTISPECIES: ABC transporter ATP-binding protein [Thioclava]MAQ38449.1 sulfonate ABC transporter ATP-binding protein [Thioclava sp.]MAQ38461.1 sulfonate ABC transporter ATP-binding protein [Thioclava sp.]RBP84957.1 NitT/TauT family transport system ATP-binding protein [Rhodobacter sp. 140A]|tara:strand:- start:1050 stop:1943 length:894 start_codon:yes stop_codon:yes gene_type:complete
MSAPIIQISAVSKVFGRGGDEVTALAGLDLEIARGSIVTLVGASGCGKSTLLRILAGLDAQTEGEVRVDGQAVHGPGPDRGVVFQSYSLYPWLTVEQNIAFSTRLAANRRRGEKAAHAARARALMQLVGLEKFANAYPHQLSGGMQQRVAIARALHLRPPILLMDEPFGALDAQTRELMQDLLLHVFEQEGCTIVFVTHDVEEAIYLGNRVVVLAPHPGRLDSVHEVSLPAHRSRDMIASPEFLELRRKVTERIRATSTMTNDLSALSQFGAPQAVAGASLPDLPAAGLTQTTGDQR